MQIGIQAEILRLKKDGLLAPLLIDRTKKATKENFGIKWKNKKYHGIIWATDAYESLGSGYFRTSEIMAEAITGDHSDVIKNRARKAMEQQAGRILSGCFARKTKKKGRRSRSASSFRKRKRGNNT